MVPPPPEGKRRGLRRLRRGRKKAGAEAEPAVEIVHEPPEPEAVAGTVEPAPAEPPEPEPPDPAAELDARFDAARERLRAKIAPPDPED